MSTNPNSEPYGTEPKVPDTHVENAYEPDEKQRASDMKNDAMEAEQAEIDLGVLDAVKAYPMASLWAFVMSCTIVCGPGFPHTFPRHPRDDRR